MAQKNPLQVTEKLIRNLSNATQSIRDGINAVTESPTEQAAAQGDLMLQKIQEAVNSGRWGERLRSVSLADWKNATLDKGVDRIASGAQASKAKILSFFEQWLPYEEQISQQVKQMPKGTIEDSVNRAAAVIRHNANFKRS
jgi:hypothetical protein